MDQRLSLIAAFARGHVIGKDNNLPWDIPKDLEHFRSVTRGKPVIMGRLTFESILSRRGEPLPGRPHFVITRNGFTYDHDRVTICQSLTEAIDLARTTYPQQELMVIGGANIYAQALPFVDRMYLTEIDLNVEGGDAFFPDFDEKDWVITERVPHPEEPIPFTCLTLDRKPA
ncbi:MAG: dihydrofolate reductase [Pseudobdellovibrionaceae bacterium]